MVWGHFDRIYWLVLINYCWAYFLFVDSQSVFKPFQFKMTEIEGFKYRAKVNYVFVINFTLHLSFCVFLWAYLQTLKLMNMKYWPFRTNITSPTQVFWPKGSKQCRFIKYFICFPWYINFKNFFFSPERLIFSQCNFWLVRYSTFRQNVCFEHWSCISEF